MLNRNRIFSGFLFPAAILGGIYFYLSTRFPIWNFDDLIFYSYAATQGWSFVVSLFLGQDMPSEYRTYSLSRVFQFILMKMTGDTPLLLVSVMAAAHLASSWLIYMIAKRAVPHSSAVACSLIWLFSPFSISRTFHHYSYIALPFLFFFVYVWVTEVTEEHTPRTREHMVILVSVLLMCLTGEGVLPPLLMYMAIKLFQRRLVARTLGHLFMVAGLLVTHYTLLKLSNPKEAGARFTFGTPSIDKLLSDVPYFMNSVGSAVLQGAHITTTSYEPYHPGTLIHSFAWQNLSWGFFLTTLAVLAGAWAAARSETSLVSSSKSFVFSASLVAAATWGIYLLMLLMGARLYSTSFALQLRYGYVALPVFAIAVFLTIRHFLGDRNLGTRILVWTLPTIFIVCWTAAQMISIPAGAEEARLTEIRLRKVASDGIRLIQVHQPSFITKAGKRAVGLANPFISWGDSPFQQDWTTDAYLGRFMNLETVVPPFIKWDEETALRVSGGGAAIVPLNSKILSAGAVSTGRDLYDYPRGDLSLSAPIEVKTVLAVGQLELLSEPVRFNSGHQLQRVIRFQQNKDFVCFVFVWNDLDDASNIFIHFIAADGSTVTQGDHPYGKTMPKLTGLTSGEIKRLRRVDIPQALASKIVQIGIGTYRVDPQSGEHKLHPAESGVRDWEGKRLLISAK